MTTRSKATTILGIVLGMCWIATGAAHAHGEIASSDPETGAVVTEVPPEVTVTYSETPADSSKFVVKDGCGDDVGTGVEVQGKALVAQVSGAQPGTWTVTWDVLSAEDGHETHGSISFKVKGDPNCSGGGQPTTPVPTKDEPQSLPVPVIIGAVIGAVLIAAALIVRRSAGRD